MLESQPLEQPVQRKKSREQIQKYTKWGLLQVLKSFSEMFDTRKN